MYVCMYVCMYATYTYICWLPNNLQPNMIGKSWYGRLVSLTLCLFSKFSSGTDPEILKKRALYVAHHGWPGKKIIGFRWSKKAKITLKSISF